MHEMSICEGILLSLEEQAKQHAFTKVKTVWVEIGQFAGVEKEALYFSWDVVVRNSLADGAKLEIIDLPGQAWCFDCAETVEVMERFATCPQCGGAHLQVTGGEELRIKEIEVE